MSFKRLKIKGLIAEQGLSIKGFSEKYDIPYSTLIQILNGSRNPNSKTINKIASALSVSLDELFKTE